MPPISTMQDSRPLFVASNKEAHARSNQRLSSPTEAVSPCTTAAIHRAAINIAAHIQTLSEANKPITKAIALQCTAAKEPPTNKHPIHIQQAHMQLQLAANGSPPTISQCAAHLASAASIEESSVQQDSGQNNWDANVESKREELNGSSGGEQKEVELLRLAAAGSGGSIKERRRPNQEVVIKVDVSDLRGAKGVAAVDDPRTLSVALRFTQPVILIREENGGHSPFTT
ncbi:hypothetical protein Dimus_028904, partial [Dionaea muscipula]